MTSELAPDLAGRIAQVAADRAAAWAAFAEVLATPSPELAARLRSGELTEIWRAGVRWLGADSAMFTAALMSLDVYARGAQRREAAADLEALRLDHAEQVTAATDLVAAVREMAALCRAEARAWSDGDPVRGKDLRAEQHAFLARRLMPALPELGRQLAQHARSHVWRTLGRLLLAFVSAESGKDYQRAALGEGRAAGGTTEPKGF